MATVFESPRFWMCLIFLMGTCGLIDYFILGFDFIYFPSLTKVLQKLYSERGRLDDEHNLPKCIADRINKYKSFEQQKFHNDNDFNKIPQNTIVNELNNGVSDDMFNNNNITNNINNNINNNITYGVYDDYDFFNNEQKYIQQRQNKIMNLKIKKITPN
jgi:hypothetical protein